MFVDLTAPANFQFSTFNFQLSIFNFQFSTFHLHAILPFSARPGPPFIKHPSIRFIRDKVTTCAPSYWSLLVGVGNADLGPKKFRRSSEEAPSGATELWGNWCGGKMWDLGLARGRMWRCDNCGNVT